MKRGIGLPILFLSVILAANPLASAPLNAQGQQDDLLPVSVTTDKQTYAPGEDIRIRIRITNHNFAEEVLRFPDAHTHDYVLDDTYRWSHNQGFIQVPFTIFLAPGQSREFDRVHEASAFELQPGRHEIRGEVVGYGKAVTTIFVSSTGTPSKLELTPIVRPNPAPFGAVINFAVSVRNATNTPVTFGHSGCPVIFKVHGLDLPPVACAEYWKTVTLEPGQSIRFGPEEFPYLSLGHDRNAFFLPAGTHIVDFEIPGVGATSARFQVLLGPGGSAISGQVVNADGSVVAGATIQAFTAGGNDSMPPPPNSAFATFQAYSGNDGRYRMDVPPGDYVLRAFSSNSNEVWYHQVYSMDEATPVHVAEGDEASGIDFALTTRPDPPPWPGLIFGNVHGATTAPGDSVAPLADAVVAAFWVQGAYRDTIDPDPGDSTNVPPPAGVYPPYPPEPGYQVFFGFTNEHGEFHIDVPYGVYRVIAFTGGYRYQWWDGADLTSDADDYHVIPGTRQAPLKFGLSPIHLTVEARIEGLVNRVVPAIHPDLAIHAGRLPGGDATGTLEHPDQILPLEGAQVSARPLVLDPRILTFREVVYQTHSGADGTYALDVPGTVPYIVDASFVGPDGVHRLQHQFFDHAPDYFSATPVDVFVGRTTENINFDLYPDLPQPSFGVISGIVYSDNGTDGPPRTLPGAIVRLRAAEDYPVPHELFARTDENGHYQFYGLPMASDGTHRYYVSAEAAGHVPNYYPGVYQWTTAQPVEPAPPEARTLTNLTLYQPPAQTPWFTVGFVRARNFGGVPVDPPPPGDDGGGTGSGGDPSTGGGSSGAGSVVPSGARILIDAALAGATDEGPQPLRGAYFYLVPSVDAEAGLLTPMAGGITTANGTVVLENVPPGVYRAYADRPGFELGWFGGNGPAGAGLISVGEGHAPVLADIVLNLKFPPPGDGSEDDLKASVFRNLHNAPNPFRPETTIMYQLGVAADVSLKVFDVNGRLVRTLIDRVSQLPGGQAVAWDGRDGAGSVVGAGIYFYRVETPFEANVGKMVRAR